MTKPLVITETLGGSTLSRAARAGQLDGVFYRPRPTTRTAWQEYAREVASSVDASWLTNLHEAIAPFGEAANRLARAASGGVVVTTGQQPGLFGGPLMTFAKALSARAFADVLESQIGVPVAPVFWAATDDADFDEAAVVSIAGHADAEVLRMERTAPVGTPMSRMSLGTDVAGLAQRFRDNCGSLADPLPLDAALRAYVAGGTVGGAYVTLLRELLAPLGIAVIDASHPAVARASQSVLRRAAALAGKTADALHRRNIEIHEAGFAPQVEEVPGLSLVFTNRDGAKRRLMIAEAQGQLVPEDENTLSPTVLLRPVVERAILPSAFYVAGPGEFAYFAQVNAVARAIEFPTPLVQPRWSVTIIEPRVQRQLEALGVDRTAVRDPHALEGRIARERTPSSLADDLHRLREDIRRDVDAMRAANDGLVAERVIDGLLRSLSHRLDRMERRVVAAVKRREHEAMRGIGALRGALYPHGALQERKLSYVPFLARYGGDLVDDMLTHAEAHARALIVGVPVTPASPLPSAPAPA